MVGRPQRDGVAIAVFQAVDAKLPAFATSRPGGRGRRVIQTARSRYAWRGSSENWKQARGEAESGRPYSRSDGSRARRASSHRGRARRRPRAGRATAADVQRRPPQLALRHSPAEPAAPRPHRRDCRRAIGDITRGRAALEQESLLAGIRGADLEDGAGQPQPVSAVIGRGGGDLAEGFARAVRTSLRLKAASASGFQRRAGFA